MYLTDHLNYSYVNPVFQFNHERLKLLSNPKITVFLTLFRRDPSALTNGKKKESASEDPSSEQDNGKPKATRNILLIRHSQYNLSGSSDKERILTPLGLVSDRPLNVCSLSHLEL